MAHHSPSPSGGSSSRRLSELLGEQQEPFYLDLYLLEKGCSPAFLDVAACGGSGGCSACWPRARSTGGRLLRRPAARSKKGRPRGGGVLRLLLSKILSGATTVPAAAKKKRQQPAAIDWRGAEIDEKQSRAGRSTDAAVHASPNAVEWHHSEAEKDHEEDDDDDESKKQLSPVSVLEQRLFEHSPPPPHAQKAFVLFSELLEAAYAPTTLLSLLADARQYSSGVSKSKDGRRRSHDGGSTPTTTRQRARRKNNSSRHARREDTPFERDFGRATALVASEMAGARVRPEDVEAEREDMAADIAAAVLEALAEEAAAELLNMGDGRPRLLCG